MANTTNTWPISVDSGELLAAARELSRAGRWERALRLLDAADSGDPVLRARLALAAAEVALDSDWFAGTRLAAERVEAAEKEDGDGAWAVRFARLRLDYLHLLTGDDGLRFGPQGKDPGALADVRRRAHRLLDSAPDEVARGWAAMYLGLITDNLFAERASAPAHYAAALRAGESGGDDLLAREALRHLGDHDHDHGNHDAALLNWRRASALGARAGAVPGTLSQQLLLAVLARDAGDTAGAAALAAEVARWAEAIGARHLHAQAAGFLAGADPTAPPATDQT
ncbi:hypothetical protein AB0I00_35020 [Streptomyces sp. NPDC050803]|uniref:hypothetical protein n=1 Tax=unclassified Streptomyces TaxID=2593676 RepID=UPI003446294E